jgi:membrane-bound metal-dependent hydrolase YbcI (DUF457 family)
MMGKSHAKQGVCAAAVLGAGLSALNFDTIGQAGVMALSAALLVSGATYPDIDAEGSHATKSFGRLSHLLHSVTHIVTQFLYNATRDKRDRPQKGSHRLFTHTLLGNLFAGVVLWLLTLLGPIVSGVVVGFLLAMMVAVWRKRWKWMAWAVAAVLVFVTYDPTMTWVWGVAFGIGNMVHCFGDSCTKSGTPWLWPMSVKGKRWHNRHALPEWARIKTGTAQERNLMGLTYILALVFIGIILYARNIVELVIG